MAISVGCSFAIWKLDLRSIEDDNVIDPLVNSYFVENSPFKSIITKIMKMLNVEFTRVHKFAIRGRIER